MCGSTDTQHHTPYKSLYRQPSYLPQLRHVSSVRTKDGVGEELSANAASTRQGIRVEGMDGLRVTHVERELTTDIRLGNEDLHAVDVRALVLANRVDVQSSLARILITLVDQNVGLDLSLIEDNDLGAIRDTTECQSLCARSISELAARSLRILRELGAQSTIGVLNEQTLDLGARSAI